MAFDNLQDKLSKALRNLSGKGKLSDKNMEDTLKEIRVALLEADVNYGVVKKLYLLMSLALQVICLLVYKAQVKQLKPQK